MPALCVCVLHININILRAVTLVVYMKKKENVKDLESETGNNLDLTIAFYLTSHNMERFCVF